ncbi:MAG: gliding motility protein GldL [Flavobacteriaceae bacterium]|jgi:gliding motility-associated protein GldL|tara:strand:+ start:472 stop:1008 length:537 start_codon:yes stop_codon:yes gene_type:complete
MAFRLLNKTQMNFAYGMGASIVIIGALMKITHFQAGFLTGNLMLTIGLITEAIIFALSAFDPPAEDLNWAKVYPELDDEDGPGPGRKETPQGLLTKKLDAMLAEAKVDVSLMTSLSSSIKDFEASAKSGASSASELAKINKEFTDNAVQLQKQMQSLANNLESLNNVYGGVLSAMNKK